MQATLASTRALWLYSLLALLLFAGLWLMRVEILSMDKPALDYSPLVVTDFINDWTAAHLVREGQISTLFDNVAYGHAMDQFYGAPVEFHNWSYPPHLLPLIAPLAHFSYLQALLVWSALGLLGYYWTLRQASPSLPVSWQWVVMLSPAVLVNLAHGQTGFFCTLFLLGGLYQLPKRPWLAGILFGLLTLKPHLGILLVPTLLILGQWRAIAAAIVTTLVLVGISMLQWGWEPWQAFFVTTRAAQLSLLEDFHGFYTYLMPGVLAAARIRDLPLTAAWILYALIAVPAATCVLWMVKREGLTPRSILGLTLGTILATPYAFNYDMAFVSLALGVYLAATPLNAIEKCLLRLLWGAPVFVYLLNMMHVPLIPLVLIACIGLLTRQSLRAQTITN